MSFVTDLPVFDCILGAPQVSGNKSLEDGVDFKTYMERFRDFRPSFHGAKQGSLKDLAVTFGGFSPTLMSSEAQDGEGAGPSLREKSELFQAAYFDAKKRAAELEQARASEPRSVELEGAVWTYTVLDGVEVRIEGCQSSAARVEVPAQIEGLPVVAIAPDGMANIASA